MSADRLLATTFIAFLKNLQRISFDALFGFLVVNTMLRALVAVWQGCFNVLKKMLVTLEQVA